MRKEKLNQKKTAVSVLMLAVLILVCTGGESFAQVRRQSSVNALDYSLRSLYDSASEVTKKNRWLAQEVAKMNQEIIFLREEARSLESAETKSKITSALEDQKVLEDMPWEEERINMMYEDYVELDEEVKYMQDRLEGKGNDQKDIEQKVIALQKEVAQLSKDKSQLGERISKGFDKGEVERLRKMLPRSTRNLNYAEDKYKRLERKMGKPLHDFTLSKEKNISLKARVSQLDRRLQLAKENKATLSEEIEIIKAEDAGKIIALTNDISQLKEKRQEFKTVLHQAERKLGKEFAVPDYQPHIQQVVTDIEAIKAENKELKKDLMVLEERIFRSNNKKDQAP